jgi:hypothetical protein
MADTPAFLTLRRNRDQAGRREAPIRRVLVALLCLLLLAGLLNVFGQRPQTSKAATSAASLKVYGASRVRSGLIYEARFTITARSDLKEATLVLDSGWAEGITINTTAPSPVGEGSRDGQLVYTLGHVPAGASWPLQIVTPGQSDERRPSLAGRRVVRRRHILTSIDRTTIFPDGHRHPSRCRVSVHPAADPIVGRRESIRSNRSTDPARHDRDLQQGVTQNTSPSPIDAPAVGTIAVMTVVFSYPPCFRCSGRCLKANPSS